ncbi:MAG: hypothetical protein LUD80_03645 [Clostridiales bacterium]|nr:hypothetical protein [Clostridiales bacterium]
MFTRLHFPEKLGRCLAVISPLSFAVYLIHEQPFVRTYIMPYSSFLTYTEYHPVVMTLCIVGTAMAVYLICIVIERGRLALFGLLRVDRLTDRLSDRISAFLASFAK